MTKEQAIELLIDQVHNNMNTFLTIIGMFLAAFVYFQWRLSNKQIENLKSKALQQVDNMYKSRIEKLEEKLKRHEQYQNDHALQLANSLNNKFSQLSMDKDIVHRSNTQNDIILTIESIINNDMIDEKMKVVAMKFVEVNIDNCKHNGFKGAVEPIYKCIMDNKKLKPYYEASQQLFNSSMDSASDKK